VFDATVSDGVGPRNVQLVTTRILVAGAEGATIGVLRDHVALPVPSPDNGQILIGRASRAVPPGYEAPKPGVYAMNADGTCLTQLTTGVGVDWQPAPSVPISPRRECVDLAVSITAPGVTGLRGVPYSIVVRNEGTLPARDVGFRLSLDAGVRFVVGTATGGHCSPERSAVSCRVDELMPGFRVRAQILARPAAPGRLEASVRTFSATRDSDPASDATSVSTRVRECWISGTDFNDELRGSRAGEEICGHGGADVVDGGGGRDRLLGGRGNDTILARDGERDTIDCGPGRDRAVVDRLDRGLRGCERVARGA
jgi:uncharacterized repeat protein (TIGR01451 family)